MSDDPEKEDDTADFSDYEEDINDAQDICESSVPERPRLPTACRGIPLSERDVENIQANLRKLKYGPLSATQLFFQELKRYKDAHGISYRIDRGEDGRITRVFWTYRWCISMWKKNPSLLLMDNTYK